jgi:uncharacterized protein YggE
VVTGVGQAPVAADGSDRAAAQRAAIDAAIADAKAQADAVAHTAGTTISGVLSVSVSIGPGYPVPPGIEAPVAGAALASGRPTTVPPQPPEHPTVLTASATVAYLIG